jgi:hypothetical protein
VLPESISSVLVTPQQRKPRTPFRTRSFYDNVNTRRTHKPPNMLSGTSTRVRTSSSLFQQRHIEGTETSERAQKLRFDF